jgi:DNA-binding LytR/AlgR family response regulator
VGSKLVPVVTDDLAYFQSSDGSTEMVLKTGKRFIVDQTLDELDSVLDPIDFFRLNRQSIIGKDNVAEILKGDYQKLIVKPKIPAENDQSFVVSKYTAPSFRKWLTNSVKK